MDKSNNLCAIKVNAKYNRGRTCGHKDCKILFDDINVMQDYISDKDKLKAVVQRNGLINGDIEEVSLVRTVSVDPENWESTYHNNPELVDKYGPWNELDNIDKLKFIAKWLNKHPGRLQIDDPIYVYK